MTDSTDADLLKAYADRRSADAFAELVRRYAGLVYATSRRLTGSDADAQDVTQNCFLDLSRKCGAIHTSLSAWLHSAATFRATDVIRRRDVRRTHEQSAARREVNVDSGWAELEPLVDAAIVDLPDELREPLVMHYLQGRSQSDTAVAMGVHQSTVSRRLEQGIAKLREILTARGVELSTVMIASLLTEHATALAAPAAVVASLGKMAASGVGGQGVVVGGFSLLKIAAILAIVVAIVGAAIAALVSSSGPSNAIVATTQGSTAVPTESKFIVKREGGRVWIDGIPPLEWGKSGETTFCGALSAALAPSDRPRAYATLMGDAALAFRVRWFRPDAGIVWYGAGPVGEQQEERDRLAAVLGIPLEIEWSYPGNPNRPKVLERVVKSIDAGRPVIAYLSPSYDCAVAYGYDNGGETVLVRDYYDKPGADPAHPSTKLGGFFVFLGEPTAALMSPRDACVNALRAAVTNWHRTDRPRFDETGSFTYGEQAYAEWIDDICASDTLEEKRRKEMFQASNWSLNCLNDAHWRAAKYLRDNATLFTGEARGAVERAASLYERVGRVTGGPTWGERAVFFGPWSGKTIDAWTPAVREREMRILAEARGLDRTAAALLAQVSTEEQPLATERNVPFFALRDALKKGDDAACESLLREHPGLARVVDFGTSTGITALHWACFYDRVRVVDLLLDAGADPNALDGYYLVTPMEWAHYNRKPAALKRMEERGARIDMRMAARFNRIDLVQKLLATSGIDVNAFGTDSYEGSVCLAVLNNNPEILKLLLDAGADAKAANAGLDTPLHQAAEAGRVECARLLLAHGADAAVKNLAGKSPLDLATEKGHDEVADLFRSQPAK